jgi:hypothetical protein
LLLQSDFVIDLIHSSLSFLLQPQHCVHQPLASTVAFASASTNATARPPASLGPPAPHQRVGLKQCYGRVWLAHTNKERFEADSAARAIN